MVKSWLKMELKYSDLFQMGIDRWFLRNVEIIYPESLKQIRFTKNGDLIEGFSESQEGFSIHSYSKLTEGNELIPSYSVMIFNPNRILDGHNLYNSREERTIKALEIVKSRLRDKGINLNLQDCIVETAEMNINIPASFGELEKVIDLEFNILSKGKSKLTSGDDPDYVIKNRRVQESYWYKHKSNYYRAYDKTKEFKENQDVEIEIQITRKEYTPSQYIFHEVFKSENLDLKFSTVLQNFNLIEKMFFAFWEESLKNCLKYLETKYYDSLEREYLAYKRARKKDIERKKNDPNFKIPRGVYKFLKENFEVFDKQYILKIIESHEKNHPKREMMRAAKEFKESDGLKNIKFMADFFSALNLN